MSVHHQMINRPAIIHHAYCPPNANSFWPTSASICPVTNQCKPYSSLTYSRSDQLRIRIHENHLSYLSRDETPSKYELRAKIETLITEYLSLIPHNHKFSFKEIGDCLSKTVKTPDFDPQKAICAFEAIERYATNLLNFPWRHEFRTIFAFSGFFYRIIECNLVDYEAIFGLLGFNFDSSLNIYKFVEIPVDPDKVSKISLECLVAIVECKIMLNIQNLIKSKFPDISWNDIYSIRTDYVCNTENAVKLICDLKMTGKLIDLDLPDYSVKTFTKLDLLSPVNNNNKTILDNSLSNNALPSHVNYLESNLDSIDFIDGAIERAEPSSFELPSHYSDSHATTSLDTRTNVLPSNHFPSNFSLETSQNKSIEKPVTRDAVCLDPSINNQLNQTFAIKSNVLTSTNSNDYRADDKSKNYKLNDIDPVLLAEINQFEANKKNSVPSSKNAFSSFDRKLKVSNNENKVVERIGQLQIVNCIPKNAKPEKTPLLENITSNGAIKGPLKVKVSNLYNTLSSQSKPVNSSFQDVVVSSNWPCKSCTYKNPPNVDVCEMCHRSRIQGNESTPLTSGGRECSRCTLVNGKEDKICKACDTSLADSPTYI